MNKIIILLCITLFCFFGCDEPTRNTECYIKCCNEIKEGSDRLNLFWSKDYILETCDNYCIPRCENKN